MVRVLSFVCGCCMPFTQSQNVEVQQIHLSDLCIPNIERKHDQILSFFKVLMLLQKSNKIKTNYYLCPIWDGEKETCMAENHILLFCKFFILPTRFNSMSQDWEGALVQRRSSFRGVSQLVLNSVLNQCVLLFTCFRVLLTFYSKKKLCIL